MGWFHEDAPEHEGCVVGFVDGGQGRLRELGYPEDEGERPAIAVVAAGCVCGWRSKRFKAPFGTSWGPFVVLLREVSADNQLVGLWAEHVKAELQPRGRLSSDMLPYAGELR